MKIGKQLSADGVIKTVREGFKNIKEHRPMNVEIPLEDALMSAFAMFSLKDPSLLAFDERRQTSENLKRVYGIERNTQRYPNEKDT